MINIDPVVIVGAKKIDNTNFNLAPTQIKFNAWAFKSPVPFDQLVVDTINLLDEQVINSVDTVILSSSQGDAHSKNILFELEKIDQKRRANPRYALASTDSTLVSILNKKLPKVSDVFKVDAACASGLKALEIGSLISKTTNKLVLLFGVEFSATPYLSFCFNSLGALSHRDDRFYGPFDANRSGFALGEGAAAVAICTESTAKKLKLPIIARIDSVGSFTLCSDHSTHPTNNDELFKWLSSIMLTSNVDRKKIAYWDAHATATPLGDPAEFQLFSKFNLDCPISSLKGATGHCISASALIEIVNAIEHLQQGIIPKNHNLYNKLTDDERIILRTEKTIQRTFIKCSFGFGGRNGAAVITTE